MLMYGKNHYNTVISLQLLKRNEKKKNSVVLFLEIKKRWCVSLCVCLHSRKSNSLYSDVVG